MQTRDGKKKDGSGNPLTKKGDVFSNIDGGNVQWLNVQLSDFKNTKKLFPDYKSLDYQVLQDVVNRVETSFSNFTMPIKMAIVEASINLRVDFTTNLLLILNLIIRRLSKMSLHRMWRDYRESR